MESNEKVYIRIVFNNDDVLNNHFILLSILKRLKIIKSDEDDIYDDGKMILTEYIVMDTDCVLDFIKALQEKLPKIRFEMSNVPYEDLDSPHFKQCDKNCLITSGLPMEYFERKRQRERSEP